MARHKTIRQREAAIDARLAGIGICNLDLGGSSAPAPDPLIGQSAQANAQISKDYLDWTKQLYAETAPQRAEATKIALDMARAQTDTAKKQSDMADETYAYTKGTFRPLEQKMATDALGYDTTARRDAEAAQAQADVGTAGDAGRATMLREIAARGGDINSGNVAASLANASVREAAVKAGAGNQARKNVEAIGAAKLADAASLGRNIAATNATQTQLGLNAGNSATGNAASTGNITAQGAQLMQGGANTAIQGNASAGNLALGQYNAQTNATQAANSTSNALLGGLGQVAGSFAGSDAGSAAIRALSDKKMKKDRKPVSGKLSLAAIKKTPVESWKYKEGSAGDDGGKTHVGPMAQSVQKTMGNATAPGGKVIDLISMSGHQSAAIKELDKRLIRLENAKSKKKA